MGNPVSRTAYYTLSLRAWDASRPQPLCGDFLAASLMDDEAQRVWELFKDLRMPNVGNAARHAIIDEHLREAFAAQPDARVVVVGAGFDTRAFRLPGGNWVEVDEPALLASKESRLPAAGAPNPLVRVGVEFARESLADKLRPYATEAPAHVVVEGVLMYLPHQQRRELLDTLKALFPRHFVYCDLMRKPFFDRYGGPVHEKIRSLGASFRDLVDKPEALFSEAGYRTLARTSVALRAAESGDIGIPRFLVRHVLRTLRDGYCIWKFGIG